MNRYRITLLGIFSALLIIAGLGFFNTGALASQPADLGDFKLYLPCIMKPFQCGVDPTPPGGICPPACSSCDGTRCNIDCIDSTCRDSNVQCPPGFSCLVNCGNEGCKASTIQCPDLYTCEVYCAGGLWGCDGLAVNCSSQGMCTLVCEDLACSNTQLNCGNDVCSAECLGSGPCSLDVNCGSACSCSYP
jgi:hypothetical protein